MVWSKTDGPAVVLSMGVSTSASDCEDCRGLSNKFGNDDSGDWLIIRAMLLNEELRLPWVASDYLTSSAFQLFTQQFLKWILRFVDAWILAGKSRYANNTYIERG